MKKYLLLILVFAVICLAIHSCKVDPAILPGQKGYVAAIPPGGDTKGVGTGTGTGTGTSEASLTGTWTTATTSAGVSTDGSVTLGPSTTFNVFAGVIMNDTTKTGIFQGESVILTTDTLAYTLSKTGNKVYVTFAADPLGRTGNGPIQITSVTAHAMTWLALDPMVISTQGHSVQAAYQLTFTR